MRSDLLLDANFLVLPFQFNVEIFDEFERLVGAGYQVYTLDRTLNEALNLEDGKYHRLVHRLVDLKDIEVINARATESVDEQLVTFGEEGFTICTNDTDVKRELHDRELPHIYLRQWNHLEGRHLERL
jgi:rRNA-processing protein FCF1